MPHQPPRISGSVSKIPVSSEFSQAPCCEAYIAPMASWRQCSSSSVDFGFRHISLKDRRNLRAVRQIRLPFL